MKQQSELKQLTLIKLYRMMFDENLSFRSTKVSRPIEEVKKILKDIDYSNIGDLIEYYTSNNGTTFFYDAEMHRSVFYSLGAGNESIDRISVAFFLSLEEIVKIRDLKIEVEPTLREFFDEHIPFADDGFGNDFWIELSSGVIKKVYYDDDPPFQLMVAPSFISFCKSLRNFG